MKQQNPKTTVMLSSVVLMVLFLTASASAGLWDDYMVDRYVGGDTEVVVKVEPPEGSPWINALGIGGAVNVSWTEVSGATSYEVQRLIEGGNWDDYQIIEVESRTYTDYNVIPGQKYYYWVRGKNMAGTGPWSLSAWAKVQWSWSFWSFSSFSF